MVAFSFDPISYAGSSNLVISPTDVLLGTQGIVKASNKKKFKKVNCNKKKKITKHHSRNSPKCARNLNFTKRPDYLKYHYATNLLDESSLIYNTTNASGQ